jgi:hypothetical protein
LDDNIVIDIKGAEYPVWSDLWIFQLFLIPYRIYIYFTVTRKEMAAEQERFKEEWSKMSNAQRKKLQIKMWKQKNQ